MRNVRSAIRAVTGVVLTLALVVVLVVAGGAGAAPTTIRAEGGPAYQDPRQPVDVRVRRPARADDARAEDRADGPGQRRGPAGRTVHPWDCRRTSTRTISGRLRQGQDRLHPVRRRRLAPVGDDGKAWADFVNASRRVRARSRNRLGIPIIYGVDGVHGHNNLVRRDDFPHQIGLGATFDPRLARSSAARPASDVRATGIDWDFAPVLDTERDLRWGRYYETFGEDPLLTGTLAPPSSAACRAANWRPTRWPPPPSTSPATPRPTTATTAPTRRSPTPSCRASTCRRSSRASTPASRP